MAIVSKITGGMIAKGKGIVDYYMLRGKIAVARSWPKRRETPFRPLELEAQGVFGILSKATTLIQGKVREAWIVESIGKRPRWQDTFIGLGMKYWGVNKEIPPILLDYQIHWHSPNPELELLLLKIEEKYGKTEAQEVQTTGIISLEDIETYREKLYFSIYDIEGLRLIAPFLEFIIGKNIDFVLELQKLVGFIEEPMKVCFSDANVRIPKTKTYIYHGVKYDCVIEINPKSHKCLPIERDYGPYKEWVLTGVESCGRLVYEWANTYKEARDAVEANSPYIYTVGMAVGQYDTWHPPYWNHNYFIYRVAIQFRTNQAYLPPGAQIQYAAIRVKRYDTVYPLVLDFNVIIQDGQPEFPHDPVVASDYYRKWYLGNYGQILASELPIGEFKDIPLNRRGFERINLGGYTKFLLRSSRDIEDWPPFKSENEERIMIYTDNGNAYDPKLVIRITLTAPKVLTGPATLITKNKVRTEAVITDSGYWYDVYGIQIKKGTSGYIYDYPCGYNDHRLRVYYKNIYGLESDTEYYFRGYIWNGKSKSAGSWTMFRTLEE